MNRVRELRERAGITQEKLGSMINVQKAAVSKYENGIVPLTDDTLLKLSKIFNCSTDYILGNTDLKNYNIHNQQENKKTIEELLKEKGLDSKEINLVQNVIDNLLKEV